MPTKCSDTAETTVPSLLSTIKKELHANMNGVASAAMRQTDDYRVNWGVELPRLQEIAAEFGKHHELAQALWKESVRECKILAALIQPIDTFCEELADIWVENIHTAEIAQIVSLHLFQHLPYATNQAFCWIASDNEIRQLCGLSTIYHIVRRREMQERSVEELYDQAQSMSESSNMYVRRLANNLIGLLDEKYERKYPTG